MRCIKYDIIEGLGLKFTAATDAIYISCYINKPTITAVYYGGANGQ